MFFQSTHYSPSFSNFSKECLFNKQNLVFSFVLDQCDTKTLLSFEGTFGKTRHGPHHIRLQPPPPSPLPPLTVELTSIPCFLLFYNVSPVKQCRISAAF